MAGRRMEKEAGVRRASALMNGGLVVHPHLPPAGGSNLLAAWALQALSDEFDVSLATLEPVDLTAINRSFGTSLKERDFKTYIAPAHYRALLRVVKNPGALLDCQL